MQQRKSAKRWYDERGESIPTGYVPENKQEMEMSSQSIMKAAEKARNHLNLFYQTVIKECEKVYEILVKHPERRFDPNADQFTFYNFDKTLKIVYMKKLKRAYIYVATEYPTKEYEMLKLNYSDFTDEASEMIDKGDDIMLVVDTKDDDFYVEIRKQLDLDLDGEEDSEEDKENNDLEQSTQEDEPTEQEKSDEPGEVSGEEMPEPEQLSDKDN